MLDLIDKNKIRADDYITISMILMYLLYAIFFTLEAYVSLIVYPLIALMVTGILKIVNSLKKKNRGNDSNFNQILRGIIYIIFGWFFINNILIQPNITPNRIITLIAFPLVIVGMAGIIKGILIDIYSAKHRVLNILIGLVTLIISVMAFASTEENYIIYILTLSTIFLINILSRAALYLSEYGLSLIHLKNFKLFFYIISDYILYIDNNGNIVLSKIE